MVDVVFNHNGYDGAPSTIDYTKFVPFNSSTNYHQPYCTPDYNNLSNLVRLPFESPSTGCTILTFIHRHKSKTAGRAIRTFRCQICVPKTPMLQAPTKNGLTNSYTTTALTAYDSTVCCR